MATVEQQTKTTQETAPAVEQPAPSRDELAALCRKVYNCTNAEDMRSILDSLNAETLTAMCRIVNALISRNPEKSECIDAFIFTAMEHKALKAQTEATASEPEVFNLNPEISPDYDTAFDEDAYTPNCQYNRAVLDDEPQPRILRTPKPKSGPAPKNRRQVYDFSNCKDAKTLRKALNSGSIETLKAIAESYREFQPRTDGKDMTKKDYVDAIVKLYFPQAETSSPKVTPRPAKPIRPDDFVGAEFQEGKIYICYADRKLELAKAKLYKVIQRKKSKITVAEVDPQDIDVFISSPVTKSIEYHTTWTKYAPPTEFITFPNARDMRKGFIEHANVAAAWIYNSKHAGNAEQPNTSSEEAIPAHDMDFYDTVYSPDVQDISVIVDDIPEDHEPEHQPEPVEPKCQQKTTPHVLEDSGLWEYDHHQNRTRPGWSWLSQQARKKINPICKRNSAIINQCKTAEEIVTALCTISPMGIYNQAWYDRFEISKTCIVPRESSDEEIRAAQQKYLAEEYADLTIKRRERKAKAEARKSAPKSATRTRALRNVNCVSVYQADEVTNKNIKQLKNCSSRDQAIRKLHNVNLSTLRYIANFLGFSGARQYPKTSLIDIIVRIIFPDKSNIADKPTQITAPKPKQPRNAVKNDDSRQILIQFDEEDTPAPASAPAKPKTRRARYPRITRDYSNQILIDFGEDISGSQTDKIKAA